VRTKNNSFSRKARALAWAFFSFERRYVMKPMKSYTPTYGRAGALFVAARSGQFERCPLRDAVIIPDVAFQRKVDRFRG